YALSFIIDCLIVMFWLIDLYLRSCSRQGTQATAVVIDINLVALSIRSSALESWYSKLSYDRTNFVGPEPSSRTSSSACFAISRCFFRSWLYDTQIPHWLHVLMTRLVALPSNR